MSAEGTLEAGAAPSSPSFENMREAPRIALMMRTAKLLCESGEYVCILRDISASGVKLRLFHEPPPDTHLFLELGNGMRYAMETVWQRDDHAGFRFAAPIDVDEFMSEPSEHPRRPLRLLLQRPAMATVDGEASAVMLVNLSQHGACVDAGTKFPVSQRIRLEAEGMPVRHAHVCWRKGYAHGLAFQDAFRLDEFAACCAAMQPFISPEAADARCA